MSLLGHQSQRHIFSFLHFQQSACLQLGDVVYDETAHLRALLTDQLPGRGGGGCQTETAVSKHLITACRETQDRQSCQSLKCLLSPNNLIWSQNRDKKQRSDSTHMSAQVIPNLSSFCSEGDNTADALCRPALITDGISVRVRKCMISKFRLSQTPLAVCKTRVATSQKDRGVWQELEPDTKHVPPDTETSTLLSIWFRHLMMSERGWQEVPVVKAMKHLISKMV